MYRPSARRVPNSVRSAECFEGRQNGTNGTYGTNETNGANEINVLQKVKSPSSPIGLTALTALITLFPYNKIVILSFYSRKCVIFAGCMPNNGLKRKVKW
jgi:hypothetical protein